MRPKIIAANWKMNKNFDAGLQLAAEIARKLAQAPKQAVQVVLIPPFIHLEAINRLLSATALACLGAQNCHEQADGAFTGEISAPMLQSVGAEFILIGHSERRQHFGESSILLAQKLNTALACGLRPIFCCGESQQNREAGAQEHFVKDQLAESLFHLTEAQIGRVVIAYEPIWAIGTGHTPTPEQVQSMHQAIRQAIAQQYSEGIAQAIPILYGGSCNAQNAPALFACPDVDGGLIGKASLEADSFIAIVNSLE